MVGGRDGGMILSLDSGKEVVADVEGIRSAETAATAATDKNNCELGIMNEEWEVRRG